MVDENEVPYIDIKTLLEKYLDSGKVYCNLLKQYCTAPLPGGSGTTWFDLHNKECGADGKTQLKSSLTKDSYAIIDNTVWLKYDVLSK